MGATPRSRSPHRRAAGGWIGVAAIVTSALLLGGAGFVGAMWLRRGPSRPSVSGAVNRFRSSATGTRSVASQPRPGVYLYAGTGAEHLSFLSTTQSQVGSLPGTVTTGAGGCWTFAIDYNSFHRQSWSRCARNGRLVELGGVTDQRFDFGAFGQSEHTVVVCDPPIVLADPTAVAGHTGAVRCNGHSQTTGADQRQRGRITDLGRTSVVVHGTPVAAVHYREDFTISGGQQGSTHEEVWVAAENGLPLREVRTIEVVSPAPAPINEVTYREHGTWRLTSLTPRT
jgi:hypothetical protein